MGTASDAAAAAVAPRPRGTEGEGQEVTAPRSLSKAGHGTRESYNESVKRPEKPCVAAGRRVSMPRPSARPRFHLFFHFWWALRGDLRSLWVSFWDRPESGHGAAPGPASVRHAFDRRGYEPRLVGPG